MDLANICASMVLSELAKALPSIGLIIFSDNISANTANAAEIYLLSLIHTF